MAKMTISKGMQDYLAQLEKLQNLSREAIGAGVYAGAAVVADEVSKAIDGLPVVRNTKLKEGELLTGITSSQKQGLKDGFGIAKMQDDNGYQHVKLGFAGYNKTKTQKYPNGQPNSVIARSLESGTSFRQKNPFVSKAVKRVREQAEQAMADAIDAKIAETTEV